MESSITRRPSLTPDAHELSAFYDAFPTLVEDLAEYWNEDVDSSAIENVIKWFNDVNTVNVEFGYDKLQLGFAVVESYKMLVSNATPEQLRQARILGWSVEWMMASIIVADDMMDGGQLRKGQPCWYLRPGVGVKAINDAMYLAGAAFALVKKHLKHLPSYTPLLESLHELLFRTAVGQQYDLETDYSSQTGHTDFSRYTMERVLARGRWTDYSFVCQPIVSAMMLAGIDDPDLHANARTILRKLADFYAVEDYFVDCFGDSLILGKMGTDIETNKCTWLVVKALELCTPAQRAVLEENYGKDDAKCVAKVKAVYKELDLEKLFYELRDREWAELSDMIDRLHGPLPKEMFVRMAQKIFFRRIKRDILPSSG